MSTSCQLIAENDGLRLVVLTAKGEVFSIDQATKPTGNPAKQLSGLSVPVLVALNGDATGTGLELAWLETCEFAFHPPSSALQVWHRVFYPRMAVHNGCLG